VLTLNKDLVYLVEMNRKMNFNFLSSYINFSGYKDKIVNMTENMASFFNVGGLGVGNPFSTPVGQKIEQATDALLASENWALNMEICDLINESSDTARDAMKAIRKRLSQNAGKNNQVIMYTLTVLETCVKNCGKAFHVLVAQKDFIQDLVKLIGPKNDPPAVVQEKVLSLIQTWAAAFKNQQDLNGVTQMYMELKNKGIEFPATDLESTAPIYTPQRSVPELPPHLVSSAISPQHMLPTGGPNSGPANLSPEQIAKLQSDLEIVSHSMSILNEMLTELKPGQETPDDYALLNELTNTCKEMQSRIVDLIGRVNDDELTAELLRVNDELNNLFLRHQRFEKNRSNTTTTSPSAVLGAAMGVPSPGSSSLVGATGLSSAFAGASAMAAQHQSSSSQPQEPLLIDLVDKTDKLQIGMGSSKLGAQGVDADDFDILAQSRTDNKNDMLRDIPTVDAAAGSSASPYKRPTDQPVVSKTTKESEIDEMEAWLGSSKEIDGIEEITSSEFDKFLEERAAAAESLPTLPSANNMPENQNQTQKKKKADDEDLLAL